jgi:hypothetical protein
VKLEELQETIRHVISDRKQMKPTMKKWEEKQRVMLSKREEEKRKNCNVIFGLEKKRNKKYVDTLNVVTKFLKQVVGLKNRHSGKLEQF